MSGGSSAPGEKRVLPPVYFLAALLLMVALHLLVRSAWSLAAPLRVGGLPFVAGGIAIVLWSDGLFRRVGTTIRPFQESSALVVDGPFRLSRNPMYLGMVVVLLGTGLLLGSLPPLSVVPVFAVLLDVRFIRAEEAQLEATFGATYRAYKERVRRWI